jgi:hypothetical protein
MDWIHLAWDRAKWPSVAMKVCVDGLSEQYRATRAALGACPMRKEGVREQWTTREQ